MPILRAKYSSPTDLTLLFLVCLLFQSPCETSFPQLLPVPGHLVCKRYEISSP